MLRFKLPLAPVEPGHAREQGPGRIDGGWLTTSKSGAESGSCFWRRNVRLVPSADASQLRMGQRARQVSPDPRLMAQILRLAVAPVAPGESAKQPRDSLCRHDRVAFGEGGRIEGVVGGVPRLDVAGE